MKNTTERQDRRNLETMRTTCNVFSCLIAFGSNYRAAERDLCVKCPSLLKRRRINYVFAMEQVIDPQNNPSRL